MSTFRVVGPGRAGLSLTAALEAVGHRCIGTLGRGDRLDDAAGDVDILLITTPDDTVAETAARVDPVPETVVLHVSGSLGLDVLDGHPRRASLHPLVPLPTPAVGAARLRSGITFAVAGDALAGLLAQDLGGRAVEVADEHRTAYHAAAAIAANHLVALLGQVERVAAAAGLPLDAFGGLIRAATDDALALGPRAALTGPASRGDWRTIDGHRRTLAGLSGPRTELAAYDALVSLAQRLRLDATEGDEGAGASARAAAPGARHEPSGSYGPAAPATNPSLPASEQVA
ncbi:MAG: DUF2520 domain-containing protein [Acidimicrobiales bacterium]|nr:DUF2520 domain-containing protein [Acidimicrobiales bacterium]